MAPTHATPLSFMWRIPDDHCALCAQPPTDELMDAARQELSRGWKFIKDAAGEWDARAADALTEAGAIMQVHIHTGPGSDKYTDLKLRSCPGCPPCHVVCPRRRRLNMQMLSSDSSRVASCPAPSLTMSLHGHVLGALLAPSWRNCLCSALRHHLRANSRGIWPTCCVDSLPSSSAHRRHCRLWTRR